MLPPSLPPPLNELIPIPELRFVLEYPVPRPGFAGPHAIIPELEPVPALKLLDNP